MNYLPSYLSFLGLELPAAAQTTEIQQIVASDFDGRDQFGHSVSVSGDPIVAGALPLRVQHFFTIDSASISIQLIHRRSTADLIITGGNTNQGT
ncbi:MAG: FG-GAP repeat protein [Planctomycetes bacterium]|nr:FG-GAP repeat protein [Planctomycetota bacterium]